MHEVGLIQQALKIAEAAARAEGCTRLRRMTLRVGKYSGVDSAALRFAFEAVVPETMAELADLELIEEPASCLCGQCGCKFEPADAIFRCPECGCLALTMERGQEFEVVTIEAE